MTTQHTPVPWAVDENVGAKSELGIVADKAPCVIAHGMSEKFWPDVARANADFIVCAVNCHDDLLKACKRCLADVRFGAIWDSDGNNVEWVKMMRAAIAKAKGVQV